MTTIQSQQQRKLYLPTQRDPIARLALCVLSGAALFVAVVAPSMPTDVQAQANATPQAIVVIATPTLGAPTAEAAPAVELPAPTLATEAPEQPTESAPPPEPQVIEVQVPVYVEVTAEPPPPPPEPTQSPEPTAESIPPGAIIILPTATQTAQEFIDSFGPAPDPAAKCAFVGCLK